MTILPRSIWLATASIVLLAAADVGATTLRGFGRCLKSKGATFYGASWCPHCRAIQPFMADMLAWMILAVLVAGAVVWIRDIVRFLRGRIHRARN